MPATLNERYIAQAILTISELKFVDAEWVRDDTSRFLNEFPFEPTWYQRLFQRFGMKAYPRGVPDSIRQILESSKGKPFDDVLQMVQRLKLRDKYADALAIYFHRRRLGDLGFPLAEFKDTAALFAASLYRFAYGSGIPGHPLEIEAVWRAYAFQGAYRVFLKHKSSVNVESRILIFALSRSEQAIVALEISRFSDKFCIRMGPVAPAYDSDTVMLSDQMDPTFAASILTLHYHPGLADEKKIDLASTFRIANEVPILQSKNLQVYSIRYEASNLVGNFLSPITTGSVVGRRLESITAEDLRDVQIILKDQISRLSPADIDLVQRLNSISSPAPTCHPSGTRVSDTVVGKQNIVRSQ